MIEFLCTLAGMIAGGAVVTSIVGLREQHAQEDFMHQLESINTEKIRGITTQLASLSDRVLDNVCSHSERIRSFGDELTSTENIDTDKILEAVDKIIAANTQMQSQLQSAQRQLAQQQELIEQTTAQAKSDALTGLANRRAVDEYLSNLLEAEPKDEMIGLLLMDIDHFKRFNDTYGHLTGDAVLTSFARMIQQVLQPNDFAARYGGEEFVVVLRGTQQQDLVKQAAVIRKYVSEQTISHKDLELTITASGGLCFVQAGDNLTIAYERSDEGLYKAKEQGRNRGLWLGDNGWTDFPDVDITQQLSSASSQALSASTNAPEQEAIADDNQQQSPAAQPKLDSDPSSTEPEVLPPTIVQSDATQPTDVQHEPTEDSDTSTLDLDNEAPAYLDLSTFVEKVREHLNQLQLRELPSAFMLIEGFFEGSQPEVKASWQKTLELIQTQVRGIDILCHFRPQSAGIFFPGCSAEAAYERAGDMKRILSRSAEATKLGAMAKNFAVAVGHVLEKEEVSSVLNRIELALDEGKDSNPEQIVVHDGDRIQIIQF